MKKSYIKPSTVILEIRQSFPLLQSPNNLDYKDEVTDNNTTENMFSKKWPMGGSRFDDDAEQ